MGIPPLRPTLSRNALKHPPIRRARWAWQGGRRHDGGADSTVNMITNEAALLGPQGHGHPLGCGHHLGGSSSVWRCSRKELAYSSSSSSSDESFAPALEHAWNMMILCSLMCIVEFVTL